MFTITTILSFIVVLSLLIFVHEMGHFISAKRAGVTVEEFGFGFPPRIWGIKKGDTTYSINIIPFGGFVKMLGEDIKDKSPGSFWNKSIKNRAKIVFFGPLMNFVLAFVLLMIIYTVGFNPFIPGMEKHYGVQNNQKIIVTEVEENTPAVQAGIKEGDIIKTIDGNEIFTDLELIISIQEKKGEEMNLVIDRQGEMINKTLTPYKTKIEGYEDDYFRLGILIETEGKISSPFYLSPYVAFVEMVRVTKLVFFAIGSFFKTLILSFTVPPGVAGPIGIVSLTGNFAQLGLLYLIQFVAFLSINLGVINLAPFPALDGGRLLFMFIEKIRGKKINQKVENLINNTGFVLLIIVVLIITYHDIMRF